MNATEHYDLLVTTTFAEYMPSNGPRFPVKQSKHGLDTSNTTFGLERAGKPLQGSLGPTGYQPLRPSSSSPTQRRASTDTGLQPNGKQSSPDRITTGSCGTVSLD